MRYEIHSGQMKCISEDIHPKSMTVGKYFIVNPNDDHHPLPASHKIIVNVMQTPEYFHIVFCFKLVDLNIFHLACDLFVRR